MSDEFVPVIAGIVLGLVLRFVPSGRRIPVGLTMSLVLGCAATFASGEYHESAVYFVIDSLQVVFCAGLALAAVTRKMRRRNSSIVN
jgi:hypothetical protein